MALQVLAQTLAQLPVPSLGRWRFDSLTKLLKGGHATQAPSDPERTGRQHPQARATRHTHHSESKRLAGHLTVNLTEPYAIRTAVPT